mmetsp:Transcript_23361/g.51758  ORF Transcript_23361/g.51758 Transcript_23361/m.51758 type:complete len:411 (+) Transcript_23361:2265-3497(+)
MALYRVPSSEFSNLTILSRFLVDKGWTPQSTAASPANAARTCSSLSITESGQVGFADLRMAFMHETDGVGTSRVLNALITSSDSKKDLSFVKEAKAITRNEGWTGRIKLDGTMEVPIRSARTSFDPSGSDISRSVMRLCKVVTVSLASLSTPSRIHKSPWHAAFTSAESSHRVSPVVGSVALLCKRSLPDISLYKLNKAVSYPNSEANSAVMVDLPSPLGEMSNISRPAACSCIIDVNTDDVPCVRTKLGERLCSSLLPQDTFTEGPEELGSLRPPKKDEGTSNGAAEKETVATNGSLADLSIVSISYMWLHSLSTTLPMIPSSSHARSKDFRDDSLLDGPKTLSNLSSGKAAGYNRAKTDLQSSRGKLSSVCAADTRALDGNTKVRPDDEGPDEKSLAALSIAAAKADN